VKADAGSRSIENAARLRGLVHEYILRAPRTAGDPSNSGQWPSIPKRAEGYLARSVAGSAWIDHLALAAAILSAAHLDPSTILGYLITLNTRFSELFPMLGISTMSEWKPSRHIPMYLRSELLVDHSDHMRVRFRSAYINVTGHLRRWRESLTRDDELDLRPFILPDVESWTLQRLGTLNSVADEARKRRKSETDAVLPHFAELRAQAHFRFNRLARLRSAFASARASVAADHSNLPVSYSYDEGGGGGQLPIERLHFRIWDRRTFVLANSDRYCRATVQAASSGARRFSDRNDLFLELVRAERLVDDAPPEGLWFSELLRMGVLGCSPHEMKQRQFPEKLAWLRSWGYADPDRLPGGPGRVGGTTAPFYGKIPELLNFPGGSWTSFIGYARRFVEGVFIPVEGLYAAAFFGLVALDLFTTTGMRINEAMQVQLSRDGLVKETRPAPPGAHDQTPRVRWVLRMIPKGQRENKPSNYYVGNETIRLIDKLSNWLFTEHYALHPGEPFPVVRFDRYNGRSHRFGPAPYLLQFRHRHLPDDAIVACLRFLLHGLVFQTREGKIVVIKPHLLRHIFATHSVHVESVPVDIVAALLNQKNIDVTEYYSQPTDTIVAEAADALLTRLAAQIDVGEAVVRLPAEVRQLVREAEGKVGALAEVIGGQCCEAGFCPAKFACIGCPMNAVDPAKRTGIERRIDWLKAQVTEARAFGQVVEVARFEQQVRDCHTQLHEMDLIEQYRKDEQRGSFIALDTLTTR
jgi:hypothetical protein